MPNVIHLTALALARAMLAGPATTPGLIARMAACLGGPAAWLAPLAQRCCKLSPSTWQRLNRRSLAQLIEHDPGFRQAWLAQPKPAVRRQILRVDSHLQALPLGLHECRLPHWPNSAALAQGLAIPLAGLWRLSRPSAWQRRAHLGEQHYHCQLLQGSLSWLQRQRLRDPHLPQGAPTSPALANLCAFKLDLRLEGLAHALGARYTRYADDLVLSGPAHLRRALPRLGTWVAMMAADEGFTLNLRKTRCQGAAQRQTVCNMVVNQRLNVPRREFDRLKARLHQCVLHGPHLQNRAGHADWQAHLRGRVNWVAQLNPSKALRLQRLFEQIDWRPR